ncbi:MAG: CoA transferase [Proteobacteria bacterium]|nr:CoA transferase [Pseudomonadota bacterium]
MLAGFRILDLSDERGHLAGKILGDMGADVIKVEPPGGDPLRRRAPFLGGLEDPERGLAWLAHNTSKRGITLDLAPLAGRALFSRLVARADVVLESFAPGTMEGWGVGWEILSAENPSLVYCAITPFGRTGPYADYAAHDLVTVALGGNASMTGDADRPPVRCSLPTAYFHAAPEAALGIVMALYARDAGGPGQLVDVSMQECQVATLLSGVGQYERRGALGVRAGARLGRTREIWPAADGFVTFGLRGGHARTKNLIATVEYMAECGMAPDWLRELDWSSYRPEQLSAGELDRLEAAFGAFFESRTMGELYEQALRRRILLAPCNDPAAVLAHPQLRDRELFVEVESPDPQVQLEQPSFFARAGKDGIAIRRRAPRLGEHNDEVYGELGIGSHQLGELRDEGAL